MRVEECQQIHVEKVNSLFSSIASRYDLINDIQSFGLHRLWKRKVARLANLLEGERALDICCGTGDLIFRLAKRGGDVSGVDMNAQMLDVAHDRLAKRDQKQTILCQGDALNLPYGESTFDAVTIAYGLRNLADYKRGLAEICRVLKSGGRLVILDFGKPSSRLIRAAYYQYLRLALPVFGWLFCKNASAYSYILNSLQKYPAQDGVGEMLSELGFSEVRVTNILFGTMSIHVARR